MCRLPSVQKYAAVNTKARALKSKLLSEQDYKNLIEKKSEKEIVAYLKEKTGYKEALKDIDPNSYERDDFEFAIRKTILRDYEKITHFLTGESKKVFKILSLVRYEVEDLKLILRSISRGEDPKLMARRFLHTKSHTGVNKDALIRVKTIEDFVERLQGTIYYSRLKSLTAEDMEKRQFHMEMNMDYAYFKLLFDHTEKLDPYDRDILKKQLGINVDLQNMQFIYRAVTFYDLSSVEIFNYALPFGYYFKGNRLKRLCSVGTPEKYMEEVMDTIYAPLVERGISDIYMERAMSQALYEDYTATGDMDISQVIEYYHRVEFEMRDIISITETVRYGIEFSTARKYLIRRI